MFLLFHLVVPALLYEPYASRKNEKKILRGPLLLGALLPDLIDKPFSIFWPAIFSGRDYGHSPLLLYSVFIILFIFNRFLTPTYQDLIEKWLFSIGLGVMFHIILDIPYIPWFWPFVDYHFQFEMDHLGRWFEQLFTDPFIISTELFGLFGLLYLAVKYKIYKKDNLLVYLFVTYSNTKKSQENL